MHSNSISVYKLTANSTTMFDHGVRFKQILQNLTSSDLAMTDKSLSIDVHLCFFLEHNTNFHNFDKIIGWHCSYSAE